MENLGLTHQYNGVYQDKKVFLTGHTGFKGTWLTLWLKMLGVKVIGYSIDIPSTPSHFELLNLGEDMVSLEGDINDFEKINAVIQEEKPDFVFHLAAQALVRPSYDNPLSTLHTNILGTANVLEACRKCDTIKGVVVVTSDKCYENFEDNRPFTEADKMGGFDPYSVSKGAAELITSSYRNSFFHLDNFGDTHQTLIASARAGNVIGGGDWAQDRLIPDIVKATNQKEVVEIRSPHATRPWQHVLEPLSGYLLLGQKLLEAKKVFAEGWNFGPLSNEAFEVGEVVNLAMTSWEAINCQLNQNNKAKHEAKMLRLDCTKANQQLGWFPVWSFEDTVKRTIEWYKDYYQNQQLQTIQDLVAYSNAAAKLGYKWAINDEI